MKEKIGYAVSGFHGTTVWETFDQYGREHDAPDEDEWDDETDEEECYA